MSNDKIRIYLAGSIYNDEPHSSWKLRLKKELSDIDNHYILFDPDPCNEPDLSMVARDKAEIDKCDIFVAYIAKYTVGTSMEIYHAFLKNNKPILIVSPDGLVKGNIWIEAHCHCIFGTIEELSEHIKSMRF